MSTASQAIVDRVRSLYLSDEVDFPENLTPMETIRSLVSAGKHRQIGADLLHDLQVPDKKYGQLALAPVPFLNGTLYFSGLLLFAGALGVRLWKYRNA